MVKNKNCMSSTLWDKDELNPEFLLATRPLVITRFEPAGKAIPMDGLHCT